MKSYKGFRKVDASKYSFRSNSVCNVDDIVQNELIKVQSINGIFFNKDFIMANLEKFYKETRKERIQRINHHLSTSEN